MRLVLEKREKRSQSMAFIVPIASFIISLLIGALVLLFSKVNPLEAYGAMLKGAFGNARRIQYTIVEALPLLLCGLSVGVAFRLRFWNIGAEGQYVWGAIGVTWVIQFWNILPTPMLLPIGLVVGMIAGALWAGIPGTLKAVWSVDETLTTLMLNYVAIGVAEYLYIKAWKAPLGNLGTPQFPDETYFISVWGKFMPGYILH